MWKSQLVFPITRCVSNCSPLVLFESALLAAAVPAIPPNSRTLRAVTDAATARAFLIVMAVIVSADIAGRTDRRAGFTR